MLAPNPAVHRRLHAVDFADAMRAHGYRFIAGVPCSYLKHAIAEIACRPEFTYVATVNEGAALALCAGAALAGRKTACFLQNSGFGNLLNPLTSLTQIYHLPALLFISARSCSDDVGEEPQHLVIGRTLPALLAALDVPHFVMPRDSDGLAEMLTRADQLVEAGHTVAVLIETDAMTGSEAAITGPVRNLGRMEAIGIVAEEIDPRAIVVSTTGMISRELFAVADRPRNFYMQGSMGHAMAIGLGVALNLSDDRPVVVLDGDGAALMHMGSMATIAEQAPRRFLHIILDNEVCGTTGNQPSASATTRLEAVAAACGYARVGRCDEAPGLRTMLRDFAATDGPTCIVVKVDRAGPGPIPRITSRYTPDETVVRVRESIAPT